MGRSHSAAADSYLSRERAPYGGSYINLKTLGGRHLARCLLSKQNYFFVGVLSTLANTTEATESGHQHRQPNEENVLDCQLIAHIFFYLFYIKAIQSIMCDFILLYNCVRAIQLPIWSCVRSGFCGCLILLNVLPVL